MFGTIGNAAVDLAALKADMVEIRRKENRKTGDMPLWTALYARWGEDQRTDEFKLVYAAYNRLYRCEGPHTWGGIFRYDDNSEEAKAQREEEDLRADAKKSCDLLTQLEDYVSRYELAFKCLYRDDDLCIVTLGGEEFTLLLPAKYVQVAEYKSYDHLTAAQRHLLLNGGQEGEETGKALSTDASTSLSGASSALEEQKAAAEKLRQEIRDVQEAKTGELAAMREEIERQQRILEAKQAELMEVLEKKKAEMELMLEKMEMDIYRLDSEIYAIRCYTGECVDFLRVRSGKPAPVETPMVLHQKMRYMDEELGKLASVYNVDFSDKNIFEDLLRHNDYALDTFAPTERSLLLVQVSKENKRFVYDEKYANMLDWENKYRGTCIAMVVRDGENVYVGWTDETRIHFTDEMFLRPGPYREAGPEMEQSRFESDAAYEKRIKELAKKSLDERVSRMFVFSVLQGILDRGMVQLPSPVNVHKPSEYIIRSYADGWLEDNKYGSFDDIIKRCNERVHKGDPILSIQHLRAKALRDGMGRHAYNQSWHNDRGRGEKNRTHDVAMASNTIYPINLVERRADWTLNLHYADGHTETNPHYRDMTEAQVKAYGKNQLDVSKWRSDNNRVVGYEVERTSDLGEEEIFVSLEKGNGWNDTTARANFQVYRDEFINLRYMCSTWLLYTFTNHKTTGIRIGGQDVTFAHLIPYLKKALEFVQKRELEELEILEPVIPGIGDDPEWPVGLSEWKLETGRNLTPHTAKSFAKWREKHHGT